jgi:hypothetical protein
MFNLMDAVSGMMGGKIDANAVQGVMGMVQNHLNTHNNQPAAAAADNGLATMVAQKLGLDAGMVQMVMPQLMQVVQNGTLQQLLDSNKDGQVNMADLMGLLNR